MPVIPNPFTGGIQPWQPSDNALLATPGQLDAYVNGNTGPLVAGTVYLVKIDIPRPVTAGNIWWAVQAAGTGASTQTFTGLYSPAGLLLTGSADISADLTVTPALCPLAAPQALTGSFVWAALLLNFATTQPSIFRTGGVGSLTALDAFNTAANFRFAAHNAGGLTALPASVTPVTAGAFPMFCGLAA